MKPIQMLLCACAVSIASVSSTGIGQEWTRFRGPNGTGISEAKTIPVEWTDSDINWKLSLPGIGHSSPVLWKDKIFLTSTRDEGKAGGLILVCVSASEGKIQWQKDYSFPPHSLHKFNSFASSSPAVDASHVYVTWTTPEQYKLLALDHEGREVWSKDLGRFVSQHGGGASPMVHDGKVFLGNEQDGESSVIALDAKTGRTVWQTPRESSTAAYATPCLYQPPGAKPQLLFTSQAHGIYALDPDSGNALWEFKEAFDKRSVSSPVLAGGLVIGSCGSGGGGNFVTAIKPPSRKGETPTLAYQIRRSAPYVPTSVAVGDLLFLWSDGGIVTCLDAPTGQIKWQERVGGDFFGSPVCVNGRIYCVSTQGEVVVIEASDTFKVLARNALNEPSHATPAVANGRIYLRTLQHLVSVGGSSS